MIKNNYKTKIAILICYFGKLPWFFNYFLKSVSFNPTIQFFLVVDDETCNLALPLNVKLIYRSLQEVSEIASEKMGFEVNIEYGYKLCDFKPAYGLLFSDLIIGYDFWGHADLDIIFGDIREFMTEEILQKHDLISVRPDWITGCFLLYRNNKKMNLLFENSKDYKKVFSSAVHYCFDETNFSHDAFNEGYSYSEIETEVESMMHVVKRLEANNYIFPYFDLHIVEGVPGNLKWIHGRMIYKNQFEILFYHMIEFKNTCKFKKSYTSIPDNFSLSPTRIYHHVNLKSRHVF
jgi:hypothetical protein